MAAHDKTTVEVHEPGFDGEVSIDGGSIRVFGARPQDGANVVKEVSASRDTELRALATSVLDGEDGAAVRLLAHLGVLDPPLPE